MYKKKSLGQHFLRDESDAKRIAHAFVLPEGVDTMLEVGPGQGALTRYLLERPYELYLCELDDRLVEWLPKHFPTLEGKIIHSNFLKAELKELPNQFGLVGNFPYNISTQIVFRTLELKHRIPLMIGMFQKEVARRICAPHGSKEYGVTSVLTQVFYQTDYLYEFPPEAFDPPPKVHSSVIRLTHRNRVDAPDEGALRTVVKSAFNLRRKKMRNALSGIFSKEILAEPLFDRRAETLSVVEFEELAERLVEYNSKK
ncbi:MAG: 16S rRNA (adenine1518-N6/adenine1519-N6)-dimethyltransferase [Limisphaerales bacterium]|jgi:16S rRNA (adenine1518-N6/adenine1519-N6)-dimethyltransferase